MSEAKVLSPSDLAGIPARINTIDGIVSGVGPIPVAVKQVGSRVPPLHVLVYDTLGVEHQHRSDNARDLVRHHGWSYVSPAARTAPPVKDETDQTEERMASTDINAVELAAANKYVQALRDTLVRAGVDVDNRWGIKRLKEELTRREIILPDAPAQ